MILNDSQWFRNIGTFTQSADTVEYANFKEVRPTPHEQMSWVLH